MRRVRPGRGERHPRRRAGGPRLRAAGRTRAAMAGHHAHGVHRRRPAARARRARRPRRPGRERGGSALAEATLVVVLFTDASRMDLRRCCRSTAWRCGCCCSACPWPSRGRTGVWLLPLPVAARGPAGGDPRPDRRGPRPGLRDRAERAGPDPADPQRRERPQRRPGRPVHHRAARHRPHETGGPIAYAGLFAELVGIGIGVGTRRGWAGGRLLSGAPRATGRPTPPSGWPRCPSRRRVRASEVLGGNGFVATFTAGLVVGTRPARSLCRTPPASPRPRGSC